MEAQETGIEVLKKLDSLDKKIGKLLDIQIKAASGYDYIKVDELSELLDESKKTIYKRVYKREIPFYKPGGRTLLFKLSEIMQWIRATRHPTILELEQTI